MIIDQKTGMFVSPTGGPIKYIEGTLVRGHSEQFQVSGHLMTEMHLVINDIFFGQVLIRIRNQAFCKYFSGSRIEEYVGQNVRLGLIKLTKPMARGEGRYTWYVPKMHGVIDYQSRF